MENPKNPIQPASLIHLYDAHANFITENPRQAQEKILQDLETSAPTGNLSMHSIFVAFSLLWQINSPIPFNPFIDKFLRAKTLEFDQINQSVIVIQDTNSQETYREALAIAYENYPQLPRT